MRTLLTACLMLLTPAATLANEYTAARFDSRIEVLPGGSLRVTETIVIRFEEGTFKFFFRTVPTRRTDGVDFVIASMDGRPLATGDGPGQVEIQRKDGLRIDWHFAPTGPSTHTFELTYVARGVAYTQGGRDLVAWRALPSEHAYRIDSSRVELVLPATPLERPRIETRRVDDFNENHSDARVLVTASGIGRNGWIELWTPMPVGSVVTAPPAWQERAIRHLEYRTPSLIAGGVVLLVGLVLLFAVRQGYDSPPRDPHVSRTFNRPPDAAPPAIAGALIANGRPQLEHAMGALFSLASRGAVAIHESARGLFGHRHFRVARAASRHIAPHEEALLNEVFGARKPGEEDVPLDRARTYLVRHFSRFKAAVEKEMTEAGLFDAGRRQVRSRYIVLGVVLLVLGGTAILPVAFLVQEFGPWPFVIPFSIMTLGVAGIIFAHALTPLSNDGVRRADEWRAYRKQLRELPKDVRRSSWISGPQSPADLLPFAVALGLAASWAKVFKDRAVQLPAWFHAASSADANAGFVAFVGHGGAGTGGGAHGGGAAGGGASGAG